MLDRSIPISCYTLKHTKHPDLLVLLEHDLKFQRKWKGNVSFTKHCPLRAMKSCKTFKTFSHFNQLDSPIMATYHMDILKVHWGITTNAWMEGHAFRATQCPKESLESVKCALWIANFLRAWNFEGGNNWRKATKGFSRTTPPSFIVSRRISVNRPFSARCVNLYARASLITVPEAAPFSLA